MLECSKLGLVLGRPQRLVEGITWLLLAGGLEAFAPAMPVSVAKHTGRDSSE